MAAARSLPAFGQSAAFSSAGKRWERLQNTPQTRPIVGLEGISKVLSVGSTFTLFENLKKQFGTSEEWKKLMANDVVLVRDFKTAIGYTEENFHIFKDENGKPTYNPLNETALSFGELTLMKRHAACREDNRRVKKINASLILENMTLKSEVAALRNEIESLNRDKPVVKQEIKATIRSRGLDFGLMMVVAVLLALLFNGAHGQVTDRRLRNTSGYYRTTPVAQVVYYTRGLDDDPKMNDVSEFQFSFSKVVDCDLETNGCYLVNKTTTDDELDYSTLMSLCVGRGKRQIPQSQIDMYSLVKQCQANPVWRVTKRFCATQIIKTLQPVTCKIKEDPLTKLLVALNRQREIFQHLKWVAFKLNWNLIAMFITVLLVCTEVKKLVPTIVMFVYTYMTGTPLFTVVLAVHFFPVLSGIFACLIMLVPLPEVAIIVSVVHWFVVVVYTCLMYEEGKFLQEMSWAVIYSMALPAWYLINTVITVFRVPYLVQVVIFVITTTISIGTKYAMGVVTITNPDGSITKTTRIKASTNSIWHKVLMAQKSKRGIVPPMPDSSSKICIVSTNYGNGVGWRFQNNIYTVGHVVGSSTHVTLRWRNVECVAKVLERIELIESPETVVKIQLPGEFQAMKPFRLANEPGAQYGQLWAFDNNFQNPVSFSGWLMQDGLWINNTFETYPGTSGAPYTDQYGKLLGIHFGSNAVVATGYCLIGAFSNLYKTPVVRSASDDTSVVIEERKFDVDEIVARVIEGTKVSHAAILSEIEKMQEVNGTLAKEIQIVNQKMMAYRNKIDEIKMDLHQMQEEQHYQNMRIDLLTGFLGQKKKGKTKRTARGRKHAKAGGRLNKSHFMKMKILTEEEYKRLEEDPDFSQEDIKNLVDQLREAAWENYLMDLDDDDGAEDWVQDMLEDEENNRKIDEAIDRAYDDSYDYQCLLQQAKLTIRDKLADHIKTVKVKAPMDELNRILSHAKDSEKPQEIIITHDDGTTEEISGKEINTHKVKLETPEEKKTIIQKNTDTEVHHVRGKEDTVIKKSTTTVREIDQADEKISTEKVITQEKKKRKTVVCDSCGNSFPPGGHNFSICWKSRREKKDFCIYCVEEHPRGEHIRPLACPWCEMNFEKEKQLREHKCPKNCKGPQNTGAREKKN